MATEPPVRPKIYCRRRAVQHKLGDISDYHFRLLLQEEDFPRGIVLPGTTVEIFSEEEIDAYLAQKRVDETPVADKE